jgi:hypothetical protein
VVLSVCSALSSASRPVLNRACHGNTCVRLKIWSLKLCCIIVRFSVALFQRLAQSIMHTSCSVFLSIVQIAPSHVHDSKYTRVTTAHVHPDSATWHIDLRDTVVLSSAGAWRYHNCFIDGSTSPEYFEYHLVHAYYRVKQMCKSKTNSTNKINYCAVYTRSCNRKYLSLLSF